MTQENELLNKLHSYIEAVPERGKDKQGYTLVRYAEVAQMVDRILVQRQEAEENGE